MRRRANRQRPFAQHISCRWKHIAFPRHRQSNYPHLEKNSRIKYTPAGRECTLFSSSEIIRLTFTRHPLRNLFALGSLAQLVEQLTLNQLVRCSSHRWPTRKTKLPEGIKTFRVFCYWSQESDCLTRWSRVGKVVLVFSTFLQEFLLWLIPFTGILRGNSKA